MNKNAKVYDKVVVKGNTRLHFCLIGIERDKDIDFENITNTLNNFIKNLKFPISVVVLVNSIKTIFKDIDEEFLTIRLETECDCKDIYYNNGKLMSYKCNKKLDKETEFEFSYNIDINRSKINYDINNPDCYDYVQISNHLKYQMEILNKLKVAKPINFNENYEKMCRVYKLFYNEYPNFNDEETEIKVQCMMYILNMSNINLFWNNEDADWLCLENVTYPISVNVNDVIDDLCLFGKINEISRGFSESIEKRIKLIGNEIRNYINSFEMPVERLQEICMEHISYYTKEKLEEEQSVSLKLIDSLKYINDKKE